MVPDTFFVLGTHNRKKRLELELLLEGVSVRVATLSDFENVLDVEETGSTFLENARLKAVLQARHLGHWVLAEDSGLSVPVLGGAPGVFSARYAGEPSNDERNNQKLISSLQGISEERRDAWYSCFVCLSDPAGNIVAEASGECHGRIIMFPRGEAGFGYDPYFEIPEYHQTFAELGLAVKSVLSHRARALRRMIPQLVRLIRT